MLPDHALSAYIYNSLAPASHRSGVGIGMAMEKSLKELIAKGLLVQVLKGWCTTFPGYFLYYPSRRNQPAALTALIETLRLLR